MNDCDVRLAELRRQAKEAMKSRRSSMEKMPVEDVRKLVEELGIHQIELEMQNEELRSTQLELEQAKQKYSDLYDFAPVGYLTINEEDRIVEANLTAAKQLGIARSVLIGKPFNLYAAENYREALHIHLRNVFKTKQPQTCEINLNGRGQTNCFVQLDSTYVPDSEGSSLTRTTMTDISDRKQAEEGLKALAGRLEKSNQELQDFAFIASHDLQEPLRKIQAFGNMLITKHKDALNPQGQDYMERVTKAASRMSELLRSLLDYSRTGTSQLNYQPISLTEVAKDAASDLEFSINKVKGSVEISELPTVEADATLLRQLFQNIIENSIKYRKESEPPVVKIYGKIATATCHIMIEDNGIGFDQCYSNKIFKPFERLHGKNTPYSGTGMGLAICKKIVNRHGGEITVKSIAEQGTIFIVTLPINQEK